MGPQLGGDLDASTDAVEKRRDDRGVRIEQALAVAEAELDEVHTRRLDCGPHLRTLSSGNIAQSIDGGVTGGAGELQVGDGCQVGGGEITEVGGHHTHNAEAHKKAPGLGRLKSRER